MSDLGTQKESTPVSDEDKEFIQDFIDGIDHPSAGHQLPDGSLNPQHTEEEIRNKIGVARALRDVLEKEGRIPEVIGKFLSTYPEKKDFILAMFDLEPGYRKYTEPFREEK